MSQTPDNAYSRPGPGKALTSATRTSDPAIATAPQLATRAEGKSENPNLHRSSSATL